jgi:hypothetical protein
MRGHRDHKFAEVRRNVDDDFPAKQPEKETGEPFHCLNIGVRHLKVFLQNIFRRNTGLNLSDHINVSDQEASALIEKHLQQEQKRLDLKRNLLTRLRTVISPKKVLLLQRAELQFNRELLRRAQELRKP